MKLVWSYSTIFFGLLTVVAFILMMTILIMESNAGDRNTEYNIVLMLTGILLAVVGFLFLTNLFDYTGGLESTSEARARKAADAASEQAYLNNVPK